MVRALRNNPPPISGLDRLSRAIRAIWARAHEGGSGPVRCADVGVKVFGGLNNWRLAIGKLARLSRSVCQHPDDLPGRYRPMSSWRRLIVQSDSDHLQQNHLAMQPRRHVTRGREFQACSGCTIPTVLANQLGASTDRPVAAAVDPTTPVQATGPSGVQPKK